MEKYQSEENAQFQIAQLSQDNIVVKLIKPIGQTSANLEKGDVIYARNDR